jgi:hypothetical protein
MLLCRSVLFFLVMKLSFCSATSIKQARAELEIKLGVKIVYDSVCVDSWSLVSYSLCTDTVFLHSYLKLLEKEYSKYPYGFLKKSGTKFLVLGRELKISGVNRAAVPDPYRNFLFLAVNGAHGDSSDLYRIHVMHHELNHSSECLYWKDMYYVWKDWQALNQPDFRYRGTGAQAYENSTINWYSPVHPLPGFVNNYSTTSQEEDRSEIVAMIMTDEERLVLKTFCETDEQLRKKVLLLIDYLNQFSGTSGNFWTENTASWIFLQKKQEGQ